MIVLFTKIVGMILVFIPCVMLGFYFAKKEDFRINDLTEFRVALLYLRSEIEYSINPLPETFQNLATKTSSVFAQFFCEIESKLLKRTGQSISEIWEESFEIIKLKTYLNDDDINFLKPIGSCLGFMDKQIQVDNIKNCISQIDAKVDELKVISIKNKKMYISLGILSGLLLIILLI